MSESIEMHYTRNPQPENMNHMVLTGQTKTQHFGSTTDWFLKLFAILFLAAVTIWVTQEIWTKEMKRQDYCAQGGIGNGGNICMHHGGNS